jgi:hypothetical protein
MFKKILKSSILGWVVMPMILATWKVEIRRIMVQDQPRQKLRTTSTIKNRAW